MNYELDGQYGPGFVEKCKIELLKSINDILGTPYIIKQFQKILRGYNEININEVENPLDLQIPEKLFMMSNIEKIGDMFDAPFMCYSCHLPLKCKKGALHHMLAFHEADIDGQELKDEIKAAEERHKEMGRNEVLNHHRLCPDCGCVHEL